MPPLASLRAALRRVPRIPSVLLLLAAAACSDAVAPADPLSSPDGLTVGTLQVRAATEVVGAASPNGPAVLRTVVTLTNRGAWPLELRMSACPLRVGGHRLAARDDAPAFVYPGPPPFVPGGGACVASIVEVTVAPGASHEIVAAADLAALRAAVPAGRWFLLAALHLDAGGAPALVHAGDVTL